jgi:hypothetical protein
MWAALRARLAPQLAVVTMASTRTTRPPTSPPARTGPPVPRHGANGPSQAFTTSSGTASPSEARQAVIPETAGAGWQVANVADHLERGTWPGSPPCTTGTDPAPAEQPSDATGEESSATSSGGNWAQIHHKGAPQSAADPTAHRRKHRQPPNARTLCFAHGGTSAAAAAGHVWSGGPQRRSTPPGLMRSAQSVARVRVGAIDLQGVVRSDAGEGG